MKPDTHTLEKVLEEGKVFKTRYKTKSKSKTFEKEDEIGPLVDWFYKQLETVDREIIQNTPPDYDIRTELKHKYTITITKHLEDGQ